MAILLKKTKEIKDKERFSQKDINKEQTNIEENDINQENVDDIEKYNPMDASKLENRYEENVVNQVKGANTEDQKSQSIDTSKLETQLIHKKSQTNTNNKQTEEKSEVQVQSTEKESASENENPEVQQSNSTEKEETKTDEKEEEQINHEQNIKELGPRPTDKKKQAHSNESNEKNLPTNQNKSTELLPKSEFEEIIQQTNKRNEETNTDEKEQMKKIELETEPTERKTKLIQM